MDLNEEFIKIEQEAVKIYSEIISVYCPYLKTKINFNSKGLNHIKMKSWNRARLVSDQYLRLKFLKLAPKILNASGTLQEILVDNKIERIKSEGKWQKTMQSVVYYGFVAIIYEIKIKIIIKKVLNGPPFFWSIIPFWKNKKDPIYKQTKKVFHEGDLEND